MEVYVDFLLFFRDSNSFFPLFNGRELLPKFLSLDQHFNLHIVNSHDSCFFVFYNANIMN